MKKLITLLLLFVGMVSTVSATNYLKGTWDNWIEHEFSLLEKDKEKVEIETVTINLSAGQTYKFGIQAGSDYYGIDATMTSGSSTDYTFYTNKGDAQITTGLAGDYVFRLKWYSGTPHLTVIYPSNEEIVIHFENHDSWAAVAGYRYNDFYGKEKNWPGTTMYGNSLNTGYYDYTVKKNNNGIYNKFIFNNDNSGSETNAVEIDYSASEYWVKYNDSESKYEATTTAPAGWIGYTRSVTSGNFGTICLPYAATISGATVFKIVSTVGSGDDLTGINLESVDALEAGKAYIFKATSSTLRATYSGTYTEATADYGMMGNLSADNIPVPDGNYVVKGNKIRKVVTGGTGVTVGQYKGYITLDGISPVSARGFDFISFEDIGTTAIETVKQELKANGEYFNLAGQRVAQPAKGLYIVNGKKVIMK